MSQKLIDAFSYKQKHGWCCCPRCGSDTMDRVLGRNALSRRVDLSICNVCGGVEAIEDMPRAGGKKLPLENWALFEHPERFLLLHKDYFNFYFTFGSSEGFPFQNSYVIVEAFDRQEAIEMFRKHFPDRTPGIYNYAFDYTESSWGQTESSTRLPCAGVIHLNGRFEAAE